MTSGTAPSGAGRWELLRALGALTAMVPTCSGQVAEALGLEPWAAHEHTRLFVLELPPYASVHLSPEGKLGGDSADRVAGTWRALGLVPPAEPDHLGAVLALYSELGAASQGCTTEAARARLDHARRVVMSEHLLSWLPGYLTAISADPVAAPWAGLARDALAFEVASGPPPAGLPSSLRDAPAPVTADAGPEELLDALVAPVRAGFVLTHASLRSAGEAVGVGVRRGERRFALRAMLDQSPSGTLDWLGAHARHWSRAHLANACLDGQCALWWARRASAMASVLDALARSVPA